MRRLTLALCSLALIATMSRCRGASPPKPVPTARTLLRAAIFPYLPDAGGDTLRELANRIEREFEARNPDLDLVLRRPRPADGSFYEPERLRDYLTAPAEGESPDSGGYHVIEVDAVLLGELAREGLLRPWRVRPSGDWPRAAAPAVTADGEVFAIPHWLCGHFVFTRSDEVARARTVAELLDVARCGRTRSRPPAWLGAAGSIHPTSGGQRRPC